MKKFILMSLCLLWALASSNAYALPIEVPDFSIDPSGAQFTIGPVPAGDPGSDNITAAPSLEFGVESVPDGTLDTMMMTWEPNVTGEYAQAGWELVFGTDPDIRNQQIILSINPPGGRSGGSFGGVGSVEVRAIDNLTALAGGWGFNTDMAGAFTPANDPCANNTIVSLVNNVMHTITINIGTGPAIGSATVTQTLPAGSSFSAPNYLIAGNSNFANIASLQFFENGVLQGGLTVIPGQTTSGLLNYWDSITVTPEPATIMLLGLGGLLLRRRKK